MRFCTCFTCEAASIAASTTIVAAAGMPSGHVTHCSLRRQQQGRSRPLTVLHVVGNDKNRHLQCHQFLHCHQCGIDVGNSSEEQLAGTISIAFASPPVSSPSTSMPSYAPPASRPALPASPPALSLSLHPAAPAPASAPARETAALNFGCCSTASRCDWPTLILTRMEGATASLPLQPALPTSMRLSHAALFDRLGWHLTPAYRSQTMAPVASWGHGDVATAMAARAACSINWPVFENAANKDVNLTVFSRIGQGAGLKLGSGVGWCAPERRILATRWSLGAKERP